MSALKPFYWRGKSLEELSKTEWEALCDGCGKCCTYKLEDTETGELYQTNVCCKLLDTHACQCADYKNRKKYVSDCVQLKPENVLSFDWLPPTCAYVRVAKGKDLPKWHYLVCGDRQRIHEVGKSVQDKVLSEENAGPLDQHIIARFK
ncbi:YcgN family cysteine cluster protein [Permianibacter aggregans]|uniref:UPF0260 protein EV696_102143 n=1 Tax=Permianibacter aggregans TaxID=1510150 RepID=A0A4R6UTG8_9GAMM|nr:YcgN family cysteine cluster protein [Permianibacter aggregans]QGX38670.1 YcgN family cysteine cluster protein [Permianibacter aggregans]TDQ50461.1 hypothetical protein EV696_102143 [Permianibacter aggregans]